jgi:hypothetical protein
MRGGVTVAHERLVLNLLALAEAVPELPDDDLHMLAQLASTVAPSTTSLSNVSLAIHRQLLNRPAFTGPKAAWDALVPDHKLGLDRANQSFHPTLPIPAFAVEALGKVNMPLTPLPTHSDPDLLAKWQIETLATLTRYALTATRAFARQEDLLGWLAAQIQQRWPRPNI